MTKKAIKRAQNGTKTLHNNLKSRNFIETNLKWERKYLEPKHYQSPWSAMTFPDMKADYLKEVGALKR